MEINSDWCQEIFWNCIEMIVTFLCTCGEKPSTTSQFFRIFLFWLLREERGGEHRTTLNAPYVQRFSVLSHFTSWHTRGGTVIPTGLVRNSGSREGRWKPEPGWACLALASPWPQSACLFTMRGSVSDAPASSHLVPAASLGPSWASTLQ